jgi:hypothetical protein
MQHPFKMGHTARMHAHTPAINVGTLGQVRMINRIINRMPGGVQAYPAVVHLKIFHIIAVPGFSAEGFFLGRGKAKVEA